MLNTLNINLKTDIKNDRPTALGIKLMSQDKNNNQFILRFTNGGEPVVLDSIYTVEILTKFTNSGASRLTSATVRQEYATWEFDTAYITQDEMVYNYVYVRKAGNLVVSADANAFYFDVGLSEIDKDAGRVAEVYDENYQKYLDEFKDNVDFEEIAQAESDRQANEDIRQANELLREDNYNQKVDTAIVEADVVAKVDNKVTELTPQINDLTAQLAHNKITGRLIAKARIMIIDDDGRSEFYIKWKPILQQYNIPITCALVTRDIGYHEAYMTWEQVSELKELGVEFVSHTHTHSYMTQLTESELRTDFANSVSTLKAKGLNHKAIVYPYGDTNETVRRIAREYFEIGIDTKEGINTPPLDTFRVLRKGWFEAGRTTTADHIALVDEAIATNGLLIFKTHSQYTQFTGEQIDAVHAVIQYAQSKGVEFVTTSEAKMIFGNLIDSGDFSSNSLDLNVLDANGDAHGRNFGSSKFLLHRELKSDINGPISDFPKNCRTILQINTGDVSGLGMPGSAGLVEVFRGITDFFGEQIFHEYQKGKKHIRYWNNTSGEWSPWVLMNSNAYLGLNQATPTTAPSSSPLNGQISTTIIQTAHASGFPEDSPGLLTTYALIGNPYSYQEYVIYNTSRKYRRNYVSGAWANWERSPTVLYSLVTANFGTLENMISKEVTVTMSGVSTNDNVVVSPAGATSKNILWFAHIGSANNITITALNIGSSAVDFNKSFKVTVIKQ